MYEKFEREFYKQQGKLEEHNKRKNQYASQIRELEKQHTEANLIYSLIQEALEEYKEDYSSKLSKEITNALTKILIYHFQKVECTVSFSNDGKYLDIRMKNTYPNGHTIEGKPEDIEGGGFKNIIGLTTLMSYINQKKVINGPILLDEPTRDLSKENSPQIYKYLQDVTKTLTNQIIMNTHDDIILGNSEYGGHCIRLSADVDGYTKVEY